MVEFEQVSESSDDRSHPQPERVLDGAAGLQILASHPQTLGNFRDASAVLRLAQAVDQCTLKVADPNRILLGDPVRDHAEHLLCLHEHKPELRAMDGPGPEPFRRARENGELRLRDHPMQFHGGGVRDVVISAASGHSERIFERVMAARRAS